MNDLAASHAGPHAPLTRAALLAILAALSSRAQDFVYNNGTEPQSLDPALITGVPEARIAYALFEGLTVNDPVTAMPVPGLADRWEVSKDLRTYTFHLRAASWSDGTPLTAEDVADAWLRVLDPATASPYAYLLTDNIQGAEAYNKGRGPASGVAVRALGRHTFQVTFVGPLPYALAMLTNSAYAVTPTFAVRRYGPGQWTKPAHFIGNGPFVLKAWKPQDKIVVARNPRYWDAGNIRLDSITFLAIEDQNVAYDKYLAGELDYLPDDSIPTGRIDEVRLRPDCHETPGSMVYYFTFNLKRRPFQDVRVRKALAMAVDREELTRLVLKEGDVPTSGFVPPMGGYATARGNGYEPEQARRLLAQAGYPGGRGFPRFTVVYNTSARHKNVCEWLQQSWKKVLGIQADLQNQEWNTYLDTRQNTHDFHLVRAGWQADYPDPSNYLGMFRTGAAINDAQYANPRYDALLDQAGRMPAGEARNRVLEQAEDLLITQDQVILPCFFFMNKYLLDDRRWGGIHPNTIGIHHPRWWHRKQGG